MTLPEGTVLESTGGVSALPSPYSSSTTSLHAVTPLIYDSALSHSVGQSIYLKMDCDQPSRSFKIRGIGRICLSAVSQYGSSTHLVSSSGGNAGLAVSYAASKCGVKSTIFVPTSTEEDVVAKLRAMGATVVVGGNAWDAADSAARAFVERTESTVYIHPFEGDQLVEGHSGLVTEVQKQITKEFGQDSIDAIVCSVGGGGLLRGILQTCQQLEHKPVVVAVQNFGTDSFNQSFNAWLESTHNNDFNNKDSQKHEDAELVLPQKVVTLDAITSKATSMGTRACSLTTLHDAIRYHQGLHTQGSEIVTLTIPDQIAASTCWQFAASASASASSKDQDSPKRMVELSCASALSPFYHPWILESVIKASAVLSQKVKKGKKLNIVVEVCGGSKVNDSLLAQYRQWTQQSDKHGSQQQVRVNTDMVSRSSSSLPN